MTTPWRTLFPVFFLAAVAAAAALRLPRLETRPMHADEAVHAARFRNLWLQGRFAYDPDEFHGPTLYYATLPAAWLGGARSFADTTATMYRVVPALFGVGLVAMVWLLRDALGRGAAAVAAALLALSPGMVFYSRYFIHEMLLAFFTLAAAVCFWRWARGGRLAWCVAGGAAVGLMQATKETAVLTYAAAALAMALTAAWKRCSPGGATAQGQDRAVAAQEDPSRPVAARESGATRPGSETTMARRAWHLSAAAAAAVVVAAVFYTSFFTNARGPLDAMLTYKPWIVRAAGQSPHLHPWHFYLHRLGGWRWADGPRWSEGLILALAVAGMLAAIRPSRFLPTAADRWFVRRLALWTIAMTVGYSLIPYKTPWCAVQVLLPMALLAGVGAVALIRAGRWRAWKVMVSLSLVAAAAQLAWQSHRASFQMPADPRNPYVYAQTAADVERLAADLAQLAAASPDGLRTPLKLIWTEANPYWPYWPLPWYLRGFERLELWPKMPADPAAALVVSAAALDEPLTAALGQTHYMTGYYMIRPGVLAQLWVRDDLWEDHLRRLGRL